MLFRKTGLLLKNTLSKSIITRADHSGGIPGENLPFRLGNKWRFTIIFTIYFAVPTWAPYFVVAYHMNK